jgi:hypothetical protein
MLNVFFFTTCGIWAQSTTTFPFTGTLQNWIVPNGVTQVVAQMCGAQGGLSTGQSQGNIAGGLGANMQTTLSVSPGSTLTIVVGQSGATSGIRLCSILSFFSLIYAIILFFSCLLTAECIFLVSCGAGGNNPISLYY